MKLFFKIRKTIFLFCFIASSFYLYAEVVFIESIIDGDTVQTQTHRVIRLIGINAPEIHKRIQGKWIYQPEAYAEQSKLFLSQLIQFKTIQLEYGRQSKDKFNRYLGYLWVNNQLVEKEILKEGLATLFLKEPNIKYADTLILSQRDAIQKHKGIWSQPVEIKDSSQLQHLNAVSILIDFEIQTIQTNHGHLIFKDGKFPNFEVVIYRSRLSFLNQNKMYDQFVKKSHWKILGYYRKKMDKGQISLDDWSQLTQKADSYESAF